jgi:hypothetical protein
MPRATAYCHTVARPKFELPTLGVGTRSETTMRTLGWGMLVAAALVVAESAHAHGIWGHVHVTGWAVENMEPGELKDFLQEPEVFNALLFGAAFTDSGYFPQSGALSKASRAYAEHTHWEPFIADYVAWMVENDPPPWNTKESKKRVAFLMGCASHGFQDSVFDSLFLHQVEHHDLAGQDESDPATDGFLVMDEHLRFVPEKDLPMATLLELYAHIEGVDEDVILESVDLMTTLYVNDTTGPGLAEFYGTQYEDQLGWTRTHYLDAAVPGSLRAEIYPTMHYIGALWKRLHGTFGPDDVVTFAFPELPRRLRSHDSELPDSWVTLLFGAGVRFEDVRLSWQDSAGTEVEFEPANTRWNAGYTRLVRLQPTEALQPGGWYTVGLDAGAATVDGGTVGAFTLDFQVECTEANAVECDDLGAVPEASVDAPLPDERAGGDTATDGSSKANGCGCTSAPPALSPVPGLLGWLSLIGQRRRDR